MEKGHGRLTGRSSACLTRPVPNSLRSKSVRTTDCKWAVHWVGKMAAWTVAGWVSPWAVSTAELSASHWVALTAMLMALEAATPMPKDATILEGTA